MILITNTIILMVTLMFSINVNAQSVPDPMIEPPITPPVGLPGMPAMVNSMPVETQVLSVKGIIAVEDPKSPLNMVIINDKYYKIGGIIAQEWKVQTITKNKIVLNNIKTKEKKTIHFAGEQP